MEYSEVVEKMKTLFTFYLLLASVMAQNKTEGKSLMFGSLVHIIITHVVITLRIITLSINAFVIVPKYILCMVFILFISVTLVLLLYIIPLFENYDIIPIYTYNLYMNHRLPLFSVYMPYFNIHNLLFHFFLLML